MDNAFHHVPVLFDEVMEWMAPRPDGVYLDGTLGGGGHSEGILRLSGGTARLYGIDRDGEAIAAASAVFRPASGLPVGGDLEFADEVTLGRALEGRLPL